MQKVDELGLGQSIYGEAILATEFDEACHPQYAELLRDEGLRGLETGRKLADIGLTIGKPGYDHEAESVREGLEDFGDLGRSN
ncbi:MAG TPA: hypothetical protein VIO60_06290 [Rectinemataceae bacterium]